MFLVSGIRTKEEELDFSQTIICPNCQAYDKISGFFTYRVLSVFFIPIFKWKKEYYMRSRCCDSIFKVDGNLGRDIELGRYTDLSELDLDLITKGYGQYRCGHCNGLVDRSFDYCPKCGEKL